jgi:uncharacterized spore protein YtfJ
MATDTLAALLARLDAVRDTMRVRRVFGDAYEVDGTTVIPVARVAGGGGGGGGDGDLGRGGRQTGAGGTGSGGGVGFGVTARPVGVVVVRDGHVEWQPTVDVMRIVLGGQLVGLAALVVVGRWLRRH